MSVREVGDQGRLLNHEIWVFNLVQTILPISSSYALFEYFL